jgi:acyl phosphate:glycerol-3-phosphate acyltransferase
LGTYIFVVALAYLLGSISFAVMVSFAMGLKDPRTYGSGNPGATNVLRSGNKIAALLTLLGDGLKGWLAVYLAYRYAAEYNYGVITIAFAALAVFLGHLFPIYHRFKGGKGVATAAGILFAIDWRLGALTLGAWVLTVLISRMSSAGAIVAAVLAPVFYLMLYEPNSTAFVVGLISAFLVWRHSANIERLIAGKEPKMGANAAASAGAKVSASTAANPAVKAKHNSTKANKKSR